MKITNKQYAQGLFEATVGKEEGALKAELGNFVKILAAHGDVGKIEAILAEFEKVWQAEKGEVMANVASADELSDEVLSLIRDYVIKETGASSIVLKHQVDKELLAGFILSFNDQVVDGSARNMISNLKKELIK